MANESIRREAYKLNKLYFKTKRGKPLQKKLEGLTDELEKFKERIKKQKEEKPEDLMKLVHFGEKDIAQIQERIDNQSGGKNKPMLIKFPLIKGCRLRA